MWVKCVNKKCGGIKPLWSFNRNRSKKFGISNQCRVCDNKAAKLWMANNKERRKLYRKSYYQKNKDREFEMMRSWSSNNREKSNKIKAKYKRYNLDKQAALAAKYRFIKHKQTPLLSGLDIMKINLLYKISDYLGSYYHVDHIQPLSKGGMHHPYNLQIITAKENIIKKDRVDYNVQGIKILWRDSHLKI